MQSPSQAVGGIEEKVKGLRSKPSAIVQGVSVMLTKEASEYVCLRYVYADVHRFFTAFRMTKYWKSKKKELRVIRG